MKLEKQTEAIIIEEGTTQENIKMSLDLDSAQILMQMLSKNLYSDDIGSTIRECASNALDSHRRAGVSMPIIVSLKNSSTGVLEFTVEDFGTGLDDHDVENIISKYGKSTKRESDIEIGAMGLGFKSPLAYSSSFYFVCRKNGIERKYMMYEGEDTNSIDLLDTQETMEGNGVKIIVPVKYGDLYLFHKKIKEQLCYFEDVYFDVPGDSSIQNGFVIARHKDFQFSELSTDNNMHLCLDNVYYPLDFDKLGIARINLPIGLRFSLSDGIYPTPNREALRYTKEAKEIILNKLKTVADYFVTKYNSTVSSGTDLAGAINYYETKYRFIEFNNGSKKDISTMIRFSSIQLQKPKLDGIVLSDFSVLHKNTKNFWLGEYKGKFEIRGGRMINLDKSYSYSFYPDQVANGYTKVYQYSNKLTQLKKII